MVASLSYDAYHTDQAACRRWEPDRAPGVRSLICQLVAWGKSVRMSRRYAWGSRPRRRQHSTMLYKIALRSPASASPMNNQLRLPRAVGLIAFSTRLLSISIVSVQRGATS